MDQERQQETVSRQAPFPFPVTYEYTARRGQPAPRRASFLTYALWVVLALVLIPVILVPLYALVPPVSTLMLWRYLTFQRVERVWTPIEEISPRLIQTVVASEDGRYCSHWGVDWYAVQSVLDDYEDFGDARGASTIPMQTAKNLFLWPGRQYIRKALEVPLAYYMSAVWSKRRMMEVYLNIAEWGPDGEFGVEAAAQRAFEKSARDLSSGQAALLAGALPNPLIRDPRRPGPVLTRAAQQRQRLAGKAGMAAISCVIPRP